MDGAKITYTWTEGSPLLASAALMPVIQAYTKTCDINIDLRDISLASRILAAFPDRLPKGTPQRNDLAELRKLTQTRFANIVKTPNISASLPQLHGCIEELQQHGYNVPKYPANPQNFQEEQIKVAYSAVVGSAVNAVLRVGNSDRRAAEVVKKSAKKHPHLLGKWAPDSKTHVAHMSEGDFYGSEKSIAVDRACSVRIETAASDGTTCVHKARTVLLPGEVIDASMMSVRHLRSFLAKEIEDAKAQDVVFSVHFKATILKVVETIMFGHVIKTFFKDVFEKHARTFKALGVNPNNGLGELHAKIAKLPKAEHEAIEADIKEGLVKGPKLAMVDSDNGISNLHAPNSVIIDFSMAAMIRDSGKMYDADNVRQDTKAVIPDRTYAGVYQEVISDCKANGAFDPSTMGTVQVVGLMAQQPEEYGAQDKTFEVAKDGVVRVVNCETGAVLMQHNVEKGDIWRMYQTKDAPIQQWVKLAVARARATGFKTIFWLDPERAHDAVMIEKVNRYLALHDTAGLDIEVMAPPEACRVSLHRARQGLDTISVTGNVLRDYNSDLFPILELGTSAKMLSIVPLLSGGAMYETGTGGCAPKLLRQFLNEGHLRWDSLGEFLALAAALEDLSVMTKSPKTGILARSLNEAVTTYLDANKSPSRKVMEIDTRGSTFYLALYWAQVLAAQNDSPDLKARFQRVAAELEDNEAQIIDDMIQCQGKSVDIGGFHHPDQDKVSKAMCPSATFNAILARMS